MMGKGWDGRKWVGMRANEMLMRSRQHHGEPSIPAPRFSSATSIGCAGASKKGGCCRGGGKDEL